MKQRFTCNGQPVALIVLAGGESRRMKRDKAVLPVPGGAGTTLIEHVLSQVRDYFEAVIISASPGQRLDFLPHRIAVDPQPGQGPLMGIQAGLSASPYQTNFILACDIPDIDIDLVKRVTAAAHGCDIAVPVSAAGQYEPLFAVYRKSVLPKIETLLNSGTRQIIPLFSLCKTRTIPLPEGRRLSNLNTPEDYDKFIKRLDGSAMAV
jgi:molybdopterin-guanine dinucleotide biosynthesis protein A